MVSDAALATALVLFVGILLRACVALRGYSGEGTPPMLGDFEAQRHWMEVAVNLPPTAWYVQGKNNDLQYWGLDYPPVSAYLSWAIGRLAQACGHPELVALYASRGYESEATRVFMRRSVIACDVLVFLPAALACVVAGVAPGRARIGLFALLCALPPLMLVDHGHFQYNCVSLGLALWAAHAAMVGWPLACSVAFCLALNFKQMSLYLAPAFFCYLLSGCLRAGAAAAPGATRARRAWLTLASVVKLGVVVIFTFGLCWLPFLGSAADAVAVLRRLFPVGRQLYEDKVANVWCTLAMLPGLKLKQRLPVDKLLTLTTSATLGSLLPPCALLLAHPSRRGFLLCATACGLGFFLLSFQVHEKHVLLPLLPALLLAPSRPLEVGWLVSLCTFSLYPLLRRDGQAPSYAVLQALWPLLCHTYAAVAAAPAAAPPPTPTPTPKAAEPKTPEPFSPRKSALKAIGTIDAGIDAGIDAFQGLLSTPSKLFKDTAKEKAEAEAKAAAEAASKLKAEAEASSLLAWYERRGVRLLPAASAAGMLALHAAEALVAPPARYPDLHAVLFAAYSCAHLVAAYAAAVYCQWRISATEAPHTPFDPPLVSKTYYLAPAPATRLKAA